MLFVLAALSYYFVEKPMIRLGHRLAPPASPGRADVGAV
jgi:peptidoglycan/LPS O-acetylase OafA/YrhL